MRLVGIAFVLAGLSFWCAQVWFKTIDAKEYQKYQVALDRWQGVYAAQRYPGSLKPLRPLLPPAKPIRPTFTDKQLMWRNIVPGGWVMFLGGCILYGAGAIYSRLRGQTRELVHHMLQAEKKGRESRISRALEGLASSSEGQGPT